MANLLANCHETALELDALDGIPDRPRGALQLRNLRPFSDHPRFSVGEPFALCDRRNPAGDGAGSRLWPTYQIPRQDFWAGPEHWQYAHIRAVRVCAFLHSAPDAPFRV